MDDPTQQFIALSNKLISELKRLNDALQENSIAINSESERQHQQEEHPPEPIQVQLEENQEGQRQREHERQYAIHDSIRWANWATVIATTLAFGAAAYYACIARQQLNTFNQQLSTMDRTFKEYRKQTRLLHQQVEVTQQAIVQMAVSFADQGGTFTVIPFNYGAAPAHDILGTFIVTRKSFPGGKIIGRDTFHFGKLAVLASGQLQWVLRSPPSNRTYHLSRFTKRDADQINSTQQVEFVDATVSYNNGFEEIGPQHFCSFHLMRPSANGVGKESISDRPCSDYPDVKRETLERLAKQH